MKNAMGATRGQADAIVELTDAQEELGVIDGQFHCFRYVKVRNLKAIHNPLDEKKNSKRMRGTNKEPTQRVDPEFTTAQVTES